MRGCGQWKVCREPANILYVPIGIAWLYKEVRYMTYKLIMVPSQTLHGGSMHSKARGTGFIETMADGLTGGPYGLVGF